MISAERWAITQPALQISATENPYHPTTADYHFYGLWEYGRLLDTNYQLQWTKILALYYYFSSLSMQPTPTLQKKKKRRRIGKHQSIQVSPTEKNIKIWFLLGSIPKKNVPLNLQHVCKKHKALTVWGTFCHSLTKLQPLSFGFCDVPNCN